ncbi:GIY-YIG nuclease family protein [Lysobacter sp. K5869]|uniref:GIY-YIG nuclease family protein n=1 Tax=Lysobacter sp. K5869 TaxID=2820808 RepID=UPI001C062905|nr:GIY-YIG nuclease family protein [Lysobacter sp. K5869]QWP75470.1 GIY-YIG nuclease family protein [Lysobacter sp. K5869]
MSFLRSREPDRPAGVSEGRAFLYVLPCAYEDLLKIGHSRNPLQRAQALQPRYYEFFDLERAFALEVDKVREARSLEHALHTRLREHNAPAPLTVREQAAGLGEWYRGAYAQLQAEAEHWREQGYAVHRPLSAWLARELDGQGDALYARADQLLTQLQGDTTLLDDPGLAPLRRNLLDTLDAHRAFALDLERRLPPSLLAWYRGADPSVP